MRKLPISLIIDDPAPLVHVYREHHHAGGILASGEELKSCVPAEFLERFCDTVQQYGLCGKFSIVPMPGCRGDIVHGIEGFDMAEVKRWLDIARTRLTPNFDFCPEILTHHKAVNLDTGAFYAENEQEWAATQSRETLARYIARALELLREAGIRPTGVTSPWAFGIENEDNYVAAICDAFYSVFGLKKSWYFLHSNEQANVRPQVRFREGDRCVVSVERTVGDAFWQTIDSSRTDEEYISSVADVLLSPDGRSGQIIEALRRNSYPILVTHWQSLFSNGRETGLKALSEVARRVEEHLKDQVQWHNFSYLMEEACQA